MDQLASFFGIIMRFCYQWTHSYGLSIILFTLFSKIVLLPVSIWVQKNSIKMVKMQPEINRIKARHAGDADAIADEQSRLFKQEKYNPLASLIPLAIQIVLLLGVVAVVREPARYVLQNASLDAAAAMDMTFLGFDLTWVAAVTKGKAMLVPVFAALSSWLLSLAQNRINVLQSEQSKWNKYGMMILSVGLSLYLGFFVAAAVALYWVASNLFAILQQVLLNILIDPRKAVDYEDLRASEEELAESRAGTEHPSRKDPLRRRAREDYKRFFSIENKHLVFYSERAGFYKYYAATLEYLLAHTNIPIHYITSDPADPIFAMAEDEPQILPYFIDDQTLIPLMMKMDADVVVMTMPDLENYQIKRSYVKKDIKYIYIPHCIDSINMTMRYASVDHFDAVLLCGKHHREEIEKTEEAYGLPKKELIDCGYPLLDDMIRDYRAGRKKAEEGPAQTGGQTADRAEGPVDTGENKPTILIAPSWQEGNIVDSCLEELLTQLGGRGYRVIVRPHPQHVRLRPEKMARLEQQFASDPDIEIQTDFSSNSTVFDADMMITDWSSIAYEYAFTTERPVLFIDTPMKVMNPEYQKIDTVPINIWLRDVIGAVIAPDQLETLPAVAAEVFEKLDAYRETIRKYREDYVYHPGKAGEVGARYLIGEVFAKIREKQEPEAGGAGRAAASAETGASERTGRNANENRKTFRQFLPAVFLSAALSFLLALYAPIELYAANVEEFWFDIHVLMPYLWKTFFLLLGGFLILYLIAFLLHKKLFGLGLLLGWILLVGLYLEGSFLAGHLPPLDGSAIDWSLYRMEEIRSVAVWAAVAAAGIAGALLIPAGKRVKAVLFTSFAITAVLLATLPKVLSTNDALRHKNMMKITTEEEFTFSTEENFIVLLLDAVSGVAFEKEWKADPAYADLFDDFTFYRNTLGAYPFTEHAVPFILTGKWMENQEDYITFETQAMEDSPLFSMLEEQGYTMGLYERDLVYDSPHATRFENIHDARNDGFYSYNLFVRLEGKLVGFKYAPFPLKKKCVRDIDEFHRLQKVTGWERFEMVNFQFDEALRTKGIRTVGGKTFRFIHLEGAHSPYKYAKDLSLLPEQDGTYETNVQACLTLCDRYLSALKEAGVYDNSVILILADHGWAEARQNPLLLVKGRNESHDMVLSDAPVSQEDLMEAYRRLLDGATSETCFDWKEGDTRQRRYLKYDMFEEDRMEEYIQTGLAWDWDTMQPTGRVFVQEEKG